jgi:hypothetical protein
MPTKSRRARKLRIHDELKDVMELGRKFGRAAVVYGIKPCQMKKIFDDFILPEIEKQQEEMKKKRGF